MEITHKVLRLRPLADSPAKNRDPEVADFETL
jgi:hypothetical protein